MHRPGFLNGFKGITPRHKGHRGLGESPIGLGSFGKGVMAPPPGPPGIPPGGQPPQFIEGKWQCSGSQPPSQADGYFFCCPEMGWTKVAFDDSRPCGDNYGQTKCGPLPEGATTADAVCCESITEWAPRDIGGGDPCLQAALLKSETTGQAIPGVTETILVDDFIADREPLVSPTVMIAGILAVVILFGVTITIKLMK